MLIQQIQKQKLNFNIFTMTIVELIKLIKPIPELFINNRKYNIKTLLNN